MDDIDEPLRDEDDEDFIDELDLMLSAIKAEALEHLMAEGADNRTVSERRVLLMMRLRKTLVSIGDELDPHPLETKISLVAFSRLYRKNKAMFVEIVSRERAGKDIKMSVFAERLGVTEASASRKLSGSVGLTKEEIQIVYNILFNK